MLLINPLDPIQPGDRVDLRLIDCQNEIDVVQALLDTLTRSILHNDNEYFQSDAQLIEVIKLDLKGISEEIDRVQAAILREKGPLT